MQKEACLFESSLPSRSVIITAVSGIGKVNAALKTCELIRDAVPDYILSIGAAGSFNPSITVGDIVIASESAYHDVWCGEGNLVGQVQGLPRTFVSDARAVSLFQTLLPEAHTGLVISGDQFYIGPQEDYRQKELFPDALAVDMETAAVAQACFLKGVPFVSLRVISDVHDEMQPEHYSGFWEETAAVRFGDLAKAVAQLREL